MPGCCTPVGDWLPTIAVVLTGAAHAAAVARARRVDGRRSVRPGAVAAFTAGLVATGVALAPPFHDAAERTFSAHMVQHVLLIAVAAPLLVLGDPLRTALLGAPDPWRRRLRSVHRPRAGAHWAAWISVAITVQALVMWVWHAPVLYEAALRSDAVHSLEHVSLLATSVWAWWGLIRARRSRRGAGALALFVGAFPGTALGAALLLAPRPWYPTYVHGTIDGALADQQLAAVVMWSVTGIAYVVGAAVLFGTWLADADQRDRQQNGSMRTDRVAVPLGPVR